MIDIEHRDNASKIDQLWKRFEWVVKALSDGNPLIDAPQATKMVVAIRDAAKQLYDPHLVSMLNVFMGEQQEDLAAEIGLLGDSALDAPDNGV